MIKGSSGDMVGGARAPPHLQIAKVQYSSHANTCEYTLIE